MNITIDYNSESEKNYRINFLKNYESQTLIKFVFESQTPVHETFKYIWLVFTDIFQNLWRFSGFFEDF